jgi:Sec-independent protein secretion pathway component TatC
MVIKKLNLLINVIELKFRFIYIFFSLIVTFIVCFFFKVELFFIISNLFLQFADGFIYTSLLDPLIIYLKLSFLFTLIIILPIILYILGFFFSKSFYSFYVNYFGIY